MTSSRLVPDRRAERALHGLRERSVNFDPDELRDCGGGSSWQLDERLQALPREQPGDPEPGGPWETARRLMHGYEFADPAFVRAYYDADAALEGRDMLLEVRFHGLRFRVGCRVAQVYDRAETLAGREARVWGWAYRTLEGHFEQGEMHWKVAKWADTGEVAFAIRACSRRAQDPNPVVRLGFRLFGRREQLRFYDSTCRRMRALTEAAIGPGARGDGVRHAAEQAVARSTRGAGPVHDELARNLDRRGE